MPSASDTRCEAQIPAAVKAAIAAVWGKGPSAARAKCRGTAASEPMVPGARGESPQPNQVASRRAGRTA